MKERGEGGLIPQSSCLCVRYYHVGHMYMYEVHNNFMCTFAQSIAAIEMIRILQ